MAAAGGWQRPRTLVAGHTSAPNLGRRSSVLRRHPAGVTPHRWPHIESMFFHFQSHSQWLTGYDLFSASSRTLLCRISPHVKLSCLQKLLCESSDPPPLRAHASMVNCERTTIRNHHHNLQVMVVPYIATVALGGRYSRRLGSFAVSVTSPPVADS